MNNFKKITNIIGWVVFAIALVVYFFSAERTGSLWDCGEFVAGAYKLQVVHPPGAPLFLLVGRIFTFLATAVSEDPANIAFAVNLMSGVCSAFAAMFVGWSAMILGKLSLKGRAESPDQAETIALAGTGLVAGLGTAFCTSVWFSAVEGEVYAMSTFFTAMTFWAMIKWYNLPDNANADRWIVFSIYAAGLSVGVHLLSLLTFPALALFYYFKKYKDHNVKGMALAALVGVGLIVIIQKFIIVGIPTLWSWMELLMVNNLGLPIHSGIIPTMLIVAAVSYFSIRYAHEKNNGLLQKLLVSLVLVVISYSTVTIVVIRANANTPINMNQPSDAMRLLPYLNREQYGERPLLRGQHYLTKIVNTELEDRYGIKDGRYEIVDQKASYVFDKNDQMLFPRLTHMDENRKPLYRAWLNGKTTKPNMADNIGFFFKYQIGWMYIRYFMWNFSGRQNGDQGFFPWDLSSGHWISGIPFYDNARLGNQSQLPDSMISKARNKYFMLPFIFGLIGIFFHARRRPKDFLGLLGMFIITGIGIIVYSNQPPNEPRERDYVLVGSFFTYCIWMGMGVLGIFQLLRSRANVGASIAAPLAAALVLIAPILMGSQNFDDQSRRHHSGARDYASNFLNSCEENAIIFTYGDNDTYPLWYAQEVENIRTDVRVVNLSLIAVDWYIDQLRRKVNNSPAIKMTLTSEDLRGFKRTQIPIDPYQKDGGQQMSVDAALKFVGESHPIPTRSGKELESYLPTKNLFIPVRRNEAIANGLMSPQDSTVGDRMPFKLNKGSYMLKGDLAVMDIVANNMFERPVYFAVTCRQQSMLGLQDYTRLEGLALRMVPTKQKGDQAYGMIGNGKVDIDKFYNNFMTKFKWGGFDQTDLFVDNSYGPTIQTTRFGVLRVAREMAQRGDKKRTSELLNKYFEAFPAMNFSYDPNTLLFINVYMQVGDTEAAKKHMRILAEETAGRLAFYFSLDKASLEMGYQNDLGSYMQAKNDLLRLAKDAIKDPEFEKELQDLLGSFGVQQLQG